MADREQSTSPRKQRPCWVLLGPTASGKTELALEIARRHPVEILSVDSMQVYRGMDIGTAKPDQESLEQVCHHMIDVLEPQASFSVGQFCDMALRAIADIHSRARLPLLVCGTPLYLKALLWGLFEGPEADPEVRERLRQQAARHGTEFLHERLAAVDPVAAQRIGPNDLKRIERALEVYELTGEPISARQSQFEGPPRMAYVAVGLRWPREALYERIERRVDGMAEAGLLEEVRRVAPVLGPQAGQAVGYKEMLCHLRGEVTFEEALGLVKRNTRRVAKHQITWFRHFPGVNWIDVSPAQSLEELAQRCGTVFGNLDHVATLSYD